MTVPTRRPGRPAGRTGPDLLAVARSQFLQHGFGGTTMNDVASHAGISKASLYREHASKDALFAAVVRDWARAGRHAMRPHLNRLTEGTDTRHDLIAFAETMRAGILSSEVLRMRRLVSSESQRFPDVAREYLCESWDRNVAGLGTALSVLAERGRLELQDAAIAADQFTWLVVGAPLNRCLLMESEDLGQAATPAAAAVDTFLARYSPRR